MQAEEWYKLKKRTQAQTKDVIGVIRSFEQNQPDKIKSGYSGKLMRTEVQIDSDITLLVYQENGGNIKQAQYVCRDEEESRVFVNEVVF